MKFIYINKMIKFYISILFFLVNFNINFCIADLPPLPEAFTGSPTNSNPVDTSSTAEPKKSVPTSKNPSIDTKSTTSTDLDKIKSTKTIDSKSEKDGSFIELKGTKLPTLSTDDKTQNNFSDEEPLKIPIPPPDDDLETKSSNPIISPAIPKPKEPDKNPTPNAKIDTNIVPSITPPVNDKRTLIEKLLSFITRSNKKIQEKPPDISPKIADSKLQSELLDSNVSKKDSVDKTVTVSDLKIPLPPVDLPSTTIVPKKDKIAQKKSPDVTSAKIDKPNTVTTLPPIPQLPQPLLSNELIPDKGKIDPTVVLPDLKIPSPTLPLPNKNISSAPQIDTAVAPSDNSSISKTNKFFDKILSFVTNKNKTTNNTPNILNEKIVEPAKPILESPLAAKPFNDNADPSNHENSIIPKMTDDIKSSGLTTSKTKETITSNQINKPHNPTINTKQSSSTYDNIVDKNIMSDEKKEFIANETKQLLLPNDEVVLGKLSTNEVTKHMDFNSYASTYSKNQKTLTQRRRSQDVRNFIRTYYGQNKARDVTDTISTRAARCKALCAIQKNDIDTLRVLLDNYPILQKNLLDQAIREDNYHLAKFLIMRGVNLPSNNYNFITSPSIAKLIRSAHEACN